jgi:hypothetical protein
MSKKGSMPPELLAHFKKKQEEKEGSPEDKKMGDKERRKEAVKKARVRLEEQKRGRKHDKNEEAGKKGSEKA